MKTEETKYFNLYFRSNSLLDHENAISRRAQLTFSSGLWGGATTTDGLNSTARTKRDVETRYGTASRDSLLILLFSNSLFST